MKKVFVLFGSVSLFLQTHLVTQNAAASCNDSFSDSQIVIETSTVAALPRSFDAQRTEELRQLYSAIRLPLTKVQIKDLVSKSRTLLNLRADPDVLVEVFPLGLSITPESQPPLWIAMQLVQPELVGLYLDFGAADQIRIDRNRGPFKNPLTGRSYYLSEYQTFLFSLLQQNYSRDPNFAISVRRELSQFNEKLRTAVFFPNGLPGTAKSRLEATRQLAKIEIPDSWQPRDLDRIYLNVEHLLKLGADPNLVGVESVRNPRGAASLLGQAVYKDAGEIALLLVQYGASTIVANGVSGVNLVEYAENTEGEYELARNLEAARRELVRKYLRINARD